MATFCVTWLQLLALWIPKFCTFGRNHDSEHTWLAMNSLMSMSYILTVGLRSQKCKLKTRNFSTFDPVVYSRKSLRLWTMSRWSLSPSPSAIMAEVSWPRYSFKRVFKGSSRRYELLDLANFCKKKTPGGFRIIGSVKSKLCKYMFDNCKQVSQHKKFLGRWNSGR